MSVVSIINSGEAVHMFTDGGLFNRGVVERITNKVRIFPHLNAAFSFRSSIGWWPHFIERLGYSYSSFDHVVEGITEFFCEGVSSITSGRQLHGEELWFCGWSDERQRFEAYGIGSHGFRKGVHGVISRPWELTRIDGNVIVPIDPTFYQRLEKLPQNNIEELGASIAECQRQLIWKSAQGDEEILVGGHIQLTTVERDMISQKILKSWPDLGVKVSFFDVSEDVSALSADTGSGGAAGFVPAPVAGDAAAGKFLKADGTWAVPPGIRYDAPQSLSSGQQQQAQENIGATAAGRALLTAANASAQRAAINAPPLPQAPAGVGQWTGINSSAGGAAVLPAGGTWSWLRLPKTVSTGAWGGGITAGVDAGGTTIGAGTSDIQWHCLAWRIA